MLDHEWPLFRHCRPAFDLRLHSIEIELAPCIGGNSTAVMFSFLDLLLDEDEAPIAIFEPVEILLSYLVPLSASPFARTGPGEGWPGEGTSTFALCQATPRAGR